MKDYAEKDELDKVSELNDYFSNLFLKAFPTVPTSVLGRMYDNCRQSFVMAELMKENREGFLEDAEKRFSQIPKP